MAAALDWGSKALAIIQAFPACTDYTAQARLVSHKLTKVTEYENNVSTAFVLCKFRFVDGRYLDEDSHELLLTHHGSTGEIDCTWRGWSTRVIGSLKTFENGEFVMKIDGYQSPPVHNSIHWKVRARETFRDTVRCSSCCMSKFKSASHEASEGRASSNPDQWKPSYLLRHHGDRLRHHGDRLVDDLICQNSHCGAYMSLYHTAPGKYRSDVKLYTMPIPCPSVSELLLERERRISSFTSEGLPRPIARIVMDFAETEPGCFPAPEPGQPHGAVRLLDENMGLTYEFIPPSDEGDQGPNYALRTKYT